MTGQERDLSTSGTPAKADFHEAIDMYWHGRAPASLEDVMALYGVLAVAESGGRLYTTPSKLKPFVKAGRLITIDVDLTQTQPEITNVGSRPLKTADIPKLAYSHKSSGRGAKYSLTQIGSKRGNSTKEVIDTILARVRKWVNHDRVQAVATNGSHPDGWIITALSELFGDETTQLRALEQDLRLQLPTDESIPTVMTVRCRVDTTQIKGPVNTGVDQVYPAEIDVLNAAMRQYAIKNAANKNMDSGSSEGTAVGIVSGTKGHVVGTAESPLGLFSVKHPDVQPALRREEAWRNYPVSDDVAMLFAKGQDLIEACVYRKSGMETYAFPYFIGDLTAEKARLLYRSIDMMRKSSNGTASISSMAQVTRWLQNSDRSWVQRLTETELRFYTITLPVSDDKNVVAEEAAVDPYWFISLADALIATNQGPTLDPERGGFPPYKHWPLLDLPTQATQKWKTAYELVTSHSFTDHVFASRKAVADDFRRMIDHRLISGTPIRKSVLFREYLNRYRGASEGQTRPPVPLVVQQLVHFETLSRAGLLADLEAPVESDQSVKSVWEANSSPTVAQIRSQRLDCFIDRPFFRSQPRMTAVLVGVLVGQISSYEEMNIKGARPLDTQTAGKKLTEPLLARVFASALKRATEYGQKSRYNSDTLFAETIERLPKFPRQMPAELAIENTELQFCYMLGHAHGRRSGPMAAELKSEEEHITTMNEQPST